MGITQISESTTWVKKLNFSICKVNSLLRTSNNINMKDPTNNSIQLIFYVGRKVTFICNEVNFGILFNLLFGDIEYKHCPSFNKIGLSLGGIETWNSLDTSNDSNK